jgi:hypothetical protein
MMFLDMPQPGERVAFYGRVSQPTQKIEHQTAQGKSFFDETGIHVPDELWFIDQGGRRHKSEKRESFQRLLSLCQSGNLDWISVAQFDRWGVKDVDEFWKLRLDLKAIGVRLWCIQDRLEMTSANQGDCWQIFAKAVGNTASMETHADRNISKMVERALDGWHMSGSHPYGTDLVCCDLDDKRPLFRVVQIGKYTKNVSKNLYRILHYAEDGVTVAREEMSDTMPPRDCKKNGYRLAPTIETDRIETVKLIFELFDSGLDNGHIARHLDQAGITYFGKHWGWNTIDPILRNPAYVGRPAWGKVAKGYYRQTFGGKSELPPKRNRDEPLHYDKGTANYVYPRQPVFPPDSFMPPDLWERVNSRQKQHKAADRKGYKTRDIAKHPLAGIICCPDCGKLMDIHSSAAKGKDNPIRYFICSTYVRTRRKECRANSVMWKHLNAASIQMLDQAKEKLKALGKLPVNNLDMGRILAEERLLWPVIGRVFCDMMRALGRTHFDAPVNPWTDPIEDVLAHKAELKAAFNEVYRAYQNHHQKSSGTSGKRVAEIEAEIDQLGTIAAETPSERQRQSYWQRTSELEAELTRLQSVSVSLLDRLASLVEQAQRLLQRLGQMQTAKDSQLFRVFLSKIVPRFKRIKCKDGIERSYVEGFQFVPKDSLSDAVGGVMEILDTRRGKDSLLRPARSWREKSGCPSRG